MIPVRQISSRWGIDRKGSAGRSRKELKETVWKKSLFKDAVRSYPAGKEDRVGRNQGY